MIDRLLKSTSANGFSLIVRICEQILLIPIFLSVWSINAYGEWLIITAIPTFLALSDMGFITSGSNELARRASNKKLEDVENYYSHYIVLCTVWCLAFMGIILLFVCFFPLVDIFKLSFYTEEESKWIFGLLCFSALINQNSLAVLAGLRVKERYHIGLWIRALSALIKMITLIIGLYFFSISPIVVAFIILLYSIVSYYIEKIIVLNFGLKAKWIKLYKGGEVKLKDILVGVEYMLLPFAQMIILQGSIVLIGVYFTGKEVAIFSTHRTLSRLVSSILQMTTNPLTAEVGLLQKKEDRAKLKTIILLISRITIWISIFFVLILMLSGRSIFYFWTHGKINFMPKLFLILLLITLFETMWRTLSTVRLGTNQHQPLVRGYFILSIIGTAFAILIAQYSSFENTILVYLFIDIFMCVVVAKYTLPLLNITYRHYLFYIFNFPSSEIKYLVKKIFLKKGF